MQKALSVDWRVAARPLVSDCMDRLFAEIGSPLTRTRMRLLLRNMLGNVRRHSAGAALPPYLRVEREASEGGHAVRITVSDYGAGVDESVLPIWRELYTAPTPHAVARPAGSVWVCICVSWSGRRTAAVWPCTKRNPGWRLP